MDPRELGQRLQAARRERGLTQQAVAGHLSVARTTVTAMENGQRQVQPDELARLAELYGRTVNQLLRVRPVTASFAVQFRAVLRDQRTDKALEEQVIDRFRQVCDHYLYLESLLQTKPSGPAPAVYDAKHLPADRAGERVATEERSRLGLGNGPILDLRSLLEDELGLRVFLLDLPAPISGLFAYTEQHGGCIAVNRRHPLERRRWSLAHELGHYLTSRYHADVVALGDPPGRSRHERVADSFARHFLLPTAGVTRRFDWTLEAQGKITPADLVMIASYFGVSFRAMLLRLEELRRLPVGTWDRLTRRGFKVREARDMLKVDQTAEDERPFPRRYRLLAVQAYEQSLLTEGQVAELLETDRIGVRETVQQFMDDLGVEDLTVLHESLTEPVP